MGTCKVYILDDFRRAKKAPARDMKAIIEEHLAEAGLYLHDASELKDCPDGNLKFQPVDAGRERVKRRDGDEH
ncbi:hypothetical protein [Geobacter argillaceus]|uniref:Uncharacterized protein n=1 Tax=Geobacter argillaceus TaxID=345631 RepID=A0A562VMQ4_9BACT|nr:hypothetical protein [Geobacter argillaceus]TWJ19256.1 hypothetical protein JN12_01947 [Geobacter argillaceus]